MFVRNLYSKIAYIYFGNQAWIKPFTFPNWEQQLVLEFHRGRECEVHYYSDRDTMCGIQFLKLEDFIDGNSHGLKLPMEPQVCMSLIWIIQQILRL